MHWIRISGSAIFWLDGVGAFKGAIMPSFGSIRCGAVRKSVADTLSVLKAGRDTTVNVAI